MGQTDMSLEELVAETRNPHSRYSICLLINEIGELSFCGNKEAEKSLWQFLEKNNPCEQFPAYCWLSVLDLPEPETLVKLDIFRKNPANAAVVAKAKEILDRWSGRQ